MRLIIITDCSGLPHGPNSSVVGTQIILRSFKDEKMVAPFRNLSPNFMVNFRYIFKSDFIFPKFQVIFHLSEIISELTYEIRNFRSLPTPRVYNTMYTESTRVLAEKSMTHCHWVCII